MELILSIISLLSLGTSYFLAGRATKATGPLQSLFIFQLIGIPFFLFFLPFGALHASIDQLVKIGAIGVYETLVMLLFFYAMKIGIVSIVSALNDLFILIVVFLGIVFLGESWSLAKGLSVGGIALGGILLSVQYGDIKGKKIFTLLRGALPALIAAIGTGFYLFFVTKLVRENGWLIVSSGIRVSIALTSFVLLVFRKVSVPNMFGDIPWKWIVPAAFLDVLGFSLYNIAITRGEISYVTAIVSAQSLVIALLSYIFLKERLFRYQLMGLVAVVFGLIFLQFV